VLCEAETEPSLQRGLQSVLVVGRESVCRPSDVTIGPDQQRAGFGAADDTGDDVDAVGPAAHGFAHASAG
jgi:hypothetical protein